jgi:hypothetical protein
MPTLEKGDYYIHYCIKDRAIDVTSVDIMGEITENFNKKRCWVWADSLPDKVRDFVYEEAFKILERSL